MKKKKSDIGFPVQIPQKASEIQAFSPKPTVNKGLELEDIIAKIQSAPNKKTNVAEYKSIEDSQVWNKIIDRFDGNQAEKQMLLSQKPLIKGDSFIFTVESESYGSLLELQFYKLSKIYTELTDSLAYFKIEIDTSNHVVDVSKKQLFDQMAEKYPIMIQINDTFKLDFNT